jgi:hypothetical protein
MNAVPSGAGYIPSESVLDGITKIMQLFGPEAKQRRAAELDSVKAGTRNTNTRTDYIPDESSRGWASVDVARQNANTAGRQVDNQASQFSAELPLKQKASENDSRRVDVLTGNLENDRARLNAMVDQFNKQHGLNLQQFDFQKTDTDRKFKLAEDNSKLNWAELGQRAKLNDAQIRAFDDTTKELVQLYGAAGMQGEQGPARQIMLEILRRNSPEAAKAVEAVLGSQNAEGQAYLERAGKFGASASPTEKPLNFWEGFSGFNRGTSPEEYMREVEARKATERDVQMNGGKIPQALSWQMGQWTPEQEAQATPEIVGNWNGVLPPLGAIPPTTEKKKRQTQNK